MSPAALFDQSQYQKGVKHLYETGVKNVPPKYILPVSERPNVVVNGIKPTYAATTEANFKLPVIDFFQLLQEDGSNRHQVLTSLAHACENYGFFQVWFRVNYGITILESNIYHCLYFILVCTFQLLCHFKIF